ncbi:Uu.00g118120.m01.CDS01 [Anthostomella pinea]|uniref:Uu.00g118120.m01.CDS01 n=1 Tax=Anthostomella pinea TaxID=933095 RepID=A0AAI8VG94_9PEZI|nr:Uu.00g118120.m01.CDS01 [Anthostomella pinea]
MDQIALHHEASAGDTNRQVVNQLPPEVVQCLENARFLNLATCTNNQPTVSLMNFTYLPSSQYSPEPVIVMTTNSSSKKTHNIVANPNVSLLVHDWVSHRPPTQTRRPSGGSPGPEHRSSLASVLMNLNSGEISRISATINGTAELVAQGSDEEKFFREQHLENNTFDTEASTMPFGSRQLQAEQGAGQDDGGRESFIAGEEVRVIVVRIKDIRTSDWKGGVSDWVLVNEGVPAAVNGVK